MIISQATVIVYTINYCVKCAIDANFGLRILALMVTSQYILVNRLALMDTRKIHAVQFHQDVQV